MTTIGVDVGGTKCLGVVLDDDGHVVRSVKEPTPHGSELVDTLARIVAALSDGADSIEGVGVGVPGLITPDGVIEASPNLKGVAHLEVASPLRSRLGVSVHVDNDATCAAFGEWRSGAARGARNALLVTLGTGIGGGLVVDGELQRGAHGFAGEIGHMVVQADGVMCVCGRVGCWERYASGSALRMHAENVAGEKDVAGEDVVSRALAGDDAMARVVDEFARWVAVGLASLTNILDPETIVIGGGVIESSEVVMPRIRDWFARLLYSPDHRAHPELHAAELGERAGAIGAAMLARES